MPRYPAAESALMEVSPRWVEGEAVAARGAFDGARDGAASGVRVTPLAVFPEPVPVSPALEPVWSGAAVVVSCVIEALLSLPLSRDRSEREHAVAPARTSALAARLRSSARLGTGTNIDISSTWLIQSGA